MKARKARARFVRRAFVVAFSVCEIVKAGKAVVEL